LNGANIVSDLIVNGRPTQANTLIKIKRGQEEAAIAAARSNGLDDVFFKLGDDTYVASSTSLKLGGTKAGSAVYVNGKKGTVVAVDNQLNGHGTEGVFHPVGGVVAAAGVIGGVVQAVRYASSVFGSLGVVIGAVGIGLGLAINMVPTLFGRLRPKDFEALQRFSADA
jgi:hypothetical protein